VGLFLLSAALSLQVSAYTVTHVAEAPQWQIDWSYNQPRPDWQEPSPSAYINFSVILVTLEEELQPYASDDDLLALFVGDELRGMSGPALDMSTGETDNKHFLVKAYGDESGGDMIDVTLKYYNAQLRQVFSRSTTMAYNPDEVLGIEEDFIPNFTLGSAKYPIVKTIDVADILASAGITPAEGDIAAAFVGDECRGVSPLPSAAVPDGSPSGLPKHIAQHDSTAEKPSPLGNQGYAQRTPEGTPTAKDSTLKENPIPNLNYSFPNSHDKKWSLELAYAGQLDEQHRYNRPFSFRTVASDDQSQPAPTTTVPSSIDNWSDYAAYLANNSDVVSAQTRSVVMRIALNNANRPGEDKILRTSHHQMPVTWSLALRYRLTNRFAIESGMSYSRLSSDYELGADGNTIHEQQTIHYLGIPMKGIYNMYVGKRWSLYGSLGLTTEIPVRSTLHADYYVYGQYELSEKTTLHAPWQFSTTVGIGLQYHLTPSIGVFAEPSLQYFIPTQGDIETYRTEHPRTFSLPLGVRITW
jgi:hypothetical protein